MRITIYDICKENTRGHYWMVAGEVLCDKCFQMHKKFDKGMNNGNK